LAKTRKCRSKVYHERKFGGPLRVSKSQRKKPRRGKEIKIGEVGPRGSGGGEFINVGKKGLGREQ